MRITTFSVIPEFFVAATGFSILNRSLVDNLWSMRNIDIKNYGIGKYKKVDDTTYGGGGGMIMRPDVLSACLADNVNFDSPKKILLLTSPRGKLYDQRVAERLANEYDDLYIVCNRFEGVDQRVINHYKMEEISIGNYILLGGEVAALVIIESVVRLLRGVIRNESATIEDSFCGTLLNMVEYDQYTKPASWNELSVPNVLISGNHEKIKTWRCNNAKFNTDMRNSVTNK